MAAWKIQVVQQIDKNKRYPSAAIASRAHGVVYLSFWLDRQGSLTNSRVVRSLASRARSGSAGLVAPSTTVPTPARGDEGRATQYSHPL